MVSRKLIKNIIIGATCLVIPSAIVGGYFGMSKANPYYKYYRNPITGDTDGFISAYLSAQYLGAEAIIAPGFTHKSPLIELFKNYPEKVKNLGFLLLDEAITTQVDSDFKPINGSDGKPLLDYGAQNTWSITFRTDLGSIQTGISLCMFLNDYQSVFAPSGKDGDKLTFGMYGGLPYDSVTSFMGGMEAGIKWFNDNVAGKTYELKTLKPVEIVAPNSINIAKENFSGGFGPGDGDAIINSYLQLDDIDAFMPVAGPQVWSAQKKIIELNKKTILIGVDSPVENDALNQPLNFTNNGQPIGNGKYVQFSSEKNLSIAVEKALKIINNGNKLPNSEDANEYKEFIDSNNVGGFGTVAVGNIENKCVGVSEAGYSYFDRAIKLGGSDPSLDTKYNQAENMKYVFPKLGITENKDNTYSYQYLRQSFFNVLDSNNYSKDSYIDGKPVEALNLKGFIKKDDQADSNKIKIILSTPTSVLFDGSFSESAYNGLVNYYKNMGINIPRKGSK